MGLTTQTATAPRCVSMALIGTVSMGRQYARMLVGGAVPHINALRRVYIYADKVKTKKMRIEACGLRILILMLCTVWFRNRSRL